LRRFFLILKALAWVWNCKSLGLARNIAVVFLPRLHKPCFE